MNMIHIAWSRALLAILAGLGAALVAQDDAPAEPVRVKTVRPDMRDMVLPDISNLDPPVRSQMQTMFNALLTVSDQAGREAEIAEAYGALGRLFHAYDMMGLAEDCYFNANLLEPGNFQWLYMLAVAEMRLGDSGLSMGHFKQAAAKDPTYAPTWLHLGQLYLETNVLDEAKAAFEKALALEPNQAAGHFGLGQVASAMGEPQQAIAHFEKTLALVPSANRVHYMLGLVYRRAGNADKARAHLQRAGKIGVRPADPMVDELRDLLVGERVHLTMGKTAFEAGHFRDAAVAFYKAAQANPESVNAHMNLAAALTKIGEIQGAISELNLVLKLDPENGNAHYNLGTLLASMGSWQEAITPLSRAVVLAPEDREAQVKLAEALRQTGRIKEALDLYEIMLEKTPDFEEALVQKTGILVRMGQFDEVAAFLAKSHGSHPEMGRLAHVYARFLAACPRLPLRDGKKALDLASRVYSAQPTADHAETYAMALGETGQCEEALQWANQALAMAQKLGDADKAARINQSIAIFRQEENCRQPGQ